MVLHAIIDASFIRGNAVPLALHHVTHFLLACLFNSPDLPSSLCEDVPINFKLIGCLHFECADCIFLTYCEQHKRLIIFAEECQDPLISSVFSTLEI